MLIEEAFSRLSIVQDYVPVGNSNRPGKKIQPSSITIHNTDNTSAGANAAAHARYMKGADAQTRQVSWHYTVDDKFVYQSIPTNENTWHSSTKQGNDTSISIEICMNSGLDEVAAYRRAALLCAVICFRNGYKPTSQIFQHHDWSGKDCPRVLRQKPNGWKNFLNDTERLFVGLAHADVETIAYLHDHESAPSSG
jgi:N-acetylmuramoyl-L-alanine amidase CwlA